MELFKSLKDKTKSFEVPFKHFELNEPLTKDAIKEICEADIPNPKEENLNYFFIGIKNLNQRFVVINFKRNWF